MKELKKFVFDKCHESRYTLPIIKTFAATGIKPSARRDCSTSHFDTSRFRNGSFTNKHTSDLFITGKSKKFQPDILKRAIRRLEYIDLATCLEDLKVPPSDHLHALKDNREGQYAISVNDQWRICFRFVNGDAYDVEITDYH